MEIESSGHDILDETCIGQTEKDLGDMSKVWRLYRGVKLREIRDGLSEYLPQLHYNYTKIKDLTLLDLEALEAHKEDLSEMWTKLVQIKVIGDCARSSINDKFYIMAPTKFLMLMWGQTPAFDSYLREFGGRKLANELGFTYPRENKWSFDQWFGVIKSLGEFLKSEPSLRDAIECMNAEIFENSKYVPYGFFLDAYLWKSVSDLRR